MCSKLVFIYVLQYKFDLNSKFPTLFVGLLTVFMEVGKVIQIMKTKLGIKSETKTVTLSNHYNNTNHSKLLQLAPSFLLELVC